MLRMRIGFIVIAMVLSVFVGRLIQLQGIDPQSYAAMAAAEGTDNVALPAKRGDIVDRNGVALADSIDGRMVIADPKFTAANAPEIAKTLAAGLNIDYETTLERLRGTHPGSRYEYIARRVPAALATSVVDEVNAKKFQHVTTESDPVREYPVNDVAANLIGFTGVDGPLAGFERSFNHELSGKDGSESYEAYAGTRIPLGKNSTIPAVQGTTLHTTLDMDLQWFAQRTLNQALEDSDGASGIAVVMDTRSGGLLALADAPTYNANDPGDSPASDRGSRALTDVYEPGSVQKVLTLSGLLDMGLVTPGTKLKVPGYLARQDRVIHDWFPHDLIHLTLAGVLAQSSNIGTVLATDKYPPGKMLAMRKRTTTRRAGKRPFRPATLPPEH